MAVDPETEGQLEFSPYHYSYNNPVRFFDPVGRFPKCCGGFGDFLTGAGVAEIVGGALGLGASAGAEVGSGGLAIPVVAVTATGSAAVVAHGGNTAMNAINNLKNDKGRVNADGNSGGGEAKQRNKPKESGTPNSSEIQSRDKTEKLTSILLMIKMDMKSERPNPMKFLNK